MMGSFISVLKQPLAPSINFRETRPAASEQFFESPLSLSDFMVDLYETYLQSGVLKMIDNPDTRPAAASLQRPACKLFGSIKPAR